MEPVTGRLVITQPIKINNESAIQADSIQQVSGRLILKDKSNLSL